MLAVQMTHSELRVRTFLSFKNERELLQQNKIGGLGETDSDQHLMERRIQHLCGKNYFCRHFATRTDVFVSGWLFSFSFLQS